MTSANPEQYLKENDLKESLMIRMGYLREKMEFYLIIAFARTPELLDYLGTGVKPSASPPRDFRRLTCSGMTEPAISNVQVKRRIDLLDYSGKDNPSLILQNLELQQNGNPEMSLYCRRSSLVILDQIRSPSRPTPG